MYGAVDPDSGILKLGPRVFAHDWTFTDAD
jgi:hypothetical protein